MNSYTLFIKSSSGGQYNALVHCDDSEVIAMVCDCSAGMFGDFCKHLRTFFEADESLLADVSQGEIFREVSALTRRSMPGSWYAKLCADLKQIEVEQKALKKRTGELKKEFMRHLSPVKT